jgi:hypothetical protein
MGIKRIRTTHAGALPRSAGLTKMIRDRAVGGAADEVFLEHMLITGVAEAVRLQRDCGLDSINDGELSKSNFMHYITERVSGIEVREYALGDGPAPLSITARDKKKFPDYFVGGRGGFASGGKEATRPGSMFVSSHFNMLAISGWRPTSDGLVPCSRSQRTERNSCRPSRSASSSTG